MTWLAKLLHPRWLDPDPGTGEGKAAAEQAEADLEVTHARSADVNALARSLNRAGQRNHFSEAMEALAAELGRKRST